MTQEEKAIGLKGNLEDIFPELKESKDEKVKEQVIYAIDQLHVCECTKDKLRAWVEKQGEHIRTDVFIKKAKLWLAEIHRVCDITDEHGYRIELRGLQARFENYMKGE